jgi:cell division protease FtsH
MFIPKKDVLTHAMKRMLNQIATGLGGRIAEELVIGDVSSGAAGDIKQVTKIARHMVCDWGMSPLGMIAYGESQDTVFLGREITRSQTYSEETARKIDAEVFRIVDEQYSRAKEIITSRRDVLDKIASALLEFETIEGKHVLEALQFGEIRSPIVREPPPKLDDKTPGKRAGKSSPSEGLGSGSAAPAPNPA